jgi:hypothetical protein
MAQPDKQLVFISYARHDQEAAQRLHAAFVDAGINSWIDTQDLRPGQRWREGIQNAIERASHFVALLSTQAIEHRGYVQSEIRQAIDVLSEIPEGQAFLIPARLDDCDVPYRDLRALHWVDLFPSFSEGVMRIIRAVKGTTDATRHVEGRSIESLIRVLDVKEIGGGAIAFVLRDLPGLPDDAAVQKHDFEYLVRHTPRLPLASMLVDPKPADIATMYGSACAVSFNLVLDSSTPSVVVRAPLVVVNSFEPLPRHEPVYPVPFESAHIYYVEINDPHTAGNTEFSAKHLVHIRNETSGSGWRVQSDIAELGIIRLIPEIPEYFVVRVNALTPGIYDFDLLVEAQIGTEQARLPIRTGCKYLFRR